MFSATRRGFTPFLIGRWARGCRTTLYRPNSAPTRQSRQVRTSSSSYSEPTTDGLERHFATHGDEDVWIEKGLARHLHSRRNESFKINRHTLQEWVGFVLRFRVQFSHFPHHFIERLTLSAFFGIPLVDGLLIDLGRHMLGNNAVDDGKLPSRIYGSVSSNEMTINGRSTAPQVRSLKSNLAERFGSLVPASGCTCRTNWILHPSRRIQ